MIAAGVANRPEHVQMYAQSTYLHVCLSSLSGKDAEQSVIDTMKFLINNEFIRLEKATNEVKLFIFYVNLIRFFKSKVSNKS